MLCALFFFSQAQVPTFVNSILTVTIYIYILYESFQIKDTSAAWFLWFEILLQAFPPKADVEQQFCF